MPEETFAMHQPNYLPGLSYFYKMLHCDVFVLLDTVQIPRGQSFANRNRVKTPNGPTFLTVPLHTPKGAKGKITYREAEMAGTKWKQKHLRTVEMNYKKAPYFDTVFPIYKDILLEDFSFNETNVALIEAFRYYLAINANLVRLSDLLNSFGQKNALIADIAGQLGATTYLSGAGGGKDYTNPEMLQQSGISVIYSDFQHPEYSQLWGDFVPQLSILDLLMNCGKESREILKNAQ